MPTVTYSYTVTASLAIPATDFGYAIRIPADTSCQRIQREHCDIRESEISGEKRDLLGNRILTGVRYGTSARFACTVSGKALIDPLQPEVDSLGFYSDATGRAGIGPLLRNFYLHNSAVGDAVDRTCHFCRMLGNTFYCHSSAPGQRTAEDAMEAGSGSPEDMAHIILALCRLDDISARYVVGLDLLGPAVWIEVWNGWHWMPVDPRTGERHSPLSLKLAHGRDADDIALAAFSNGCVLDGVQLTGSLAGRD